MSHWLYLTQAIYWTQVFQLFSRKAEGLWGTAVFLRRRHTSELSICQFKLGEPHRCQLHSASSKPLCIDQSKWLPGIQNAMLHISAKSNWPVSQLIQGSIWSRVASWGYSLGYVGACACVQYECVCACMPTCVKWNPKLFKEQQDFFQQYHAQLWSVCFFP